MAFRVLAPQVVRIIGGNHTQAEVAPQRQHALLDDSLLCDAMLLDLEPEVFRSEDAGKP